MTFSQKAQALQEAADAEKLAAAAPQAATDGSTAAAPASTPMSNPAKPVAAISAPKELNALALIWMMLRNFLAGLFGRKA
ncbi:hypothetical protein ACVBEH_21565 [Roseateles sp. GG27B]